MPIRLRDSGAILGRVRSTLDSATAALAGAHVGPPSRSGSISSRLEDAGCQVAAFFQPAANRTGTIAALLQNFASSEFGISQPPPPPSRTGAVAAALGGVSCAVRGTYSAPPDPQESYWPNWPTMNTACLQGNATTHILDPTRHAELADKDLNIIQDFNPTSARKTTRRDRIADVRALRTDGRRVRFFKYTMLQESKKVIPVDGAQLILFELINHPTKGRPSWIAHRVNQSGDAGRVECNFDPPNSWQVNMACLVSGLNSLGENLPTAFWKDWDIALGATVVGPDLRPSLDGMFMDNFNCRPPAMFQNNGATTITDQDYNANGVVDNRNDYSAGANAGGRMWSEGHLETEARFVARFGDDWVLCPNAARFDGDYFDGQGQPPLPLSNHPYYRHFPLTFDEGVNALLGLSHSATAYSFAATGSTNSFFRSYNVHERMLEPDAQNTRTGKSAVMMHAVCVNRTVPTSEDYAYARFICAMCMLVERAAMCVQQSSSLPLSLDETLIELGAPVATRTMGTLNETTLAFSGRPADRSVGAARFHWAIFQKGMVLVRTDSPSVGAYPSADVAVPCTLPAPPSGMKWKRLGPSYFNPIIERTTRNQDPAVNSGADAGTSVSLKPYHAIFLLLVPV